MKTPPPNNSQPSSVALGSFRALPGGIWTLGFVSMFMDISSELIHSLLPVFMATVLGVSMTTIGLVEGFAEATAAVTKVFSGAISDYLGKRKFLAGLGYGLAAVTKPIFPMANTIGWVFAARFIDRIGKEGPPVMRSWRTSRLPNCVGRRTDSVSRWIPSGHSLVH